MTLEEQKKICEDFLEKHKSCGFHLGNLTLVLEIEPWYPIRVGYYETYGAYVLWGQRKSGGYVFPPTFFAWDSLQHLKIVDIDFNKELETL